MNRKNLHKKIAISILACLTSATVFANGPWTLEAGQQSYSLTRVNEAFDEFWVGAEDRQFPDKGTVTQNTTWITGNFGLTDKLQVGIIVGHTTSEKDNAPDYSGMADSKLTAKYFLLNEYSSAPLSMAVALSGIIKGTYDRAVAGPSAPGPHGPGDKANGVELSFPMARSLGPVGLVGNLGYRKRTDDVPDDLFYSLGVGTNIGETFFIQGNYLSENGRDGIDIGSAEFTGANFYATREERDLVEINGTWTINNKWSLYGGYGDVLDGRNTGNSVIMYFGVNFQP